MQRQGLGIDPRGNAVSKTVIDRNENPDPPPGHAEPSVVNGSAWQVDETDGRRLTTLAGVVPGLSGTPFGVSLTNDAAPAVKCPTNARCLPPGNASFHVTTGVCPRNVMSGRDSDDERIAEHLLKRDSLRATIQRLHHQRGMQCSVF